ncbi:DNA-binding transcriptional regulator, XRE-family HTH domain [Anaerocolumna jejuensis DSM 15929]|uniref:DNA-binding transcriptional regulator, XRE-family HTH domain n=1 Tax=Anaerocolumna jejuensis DSM 15929 TaxID=1121322 RepID=A0A1M6L2V9_9FIRM|nr:helix-turn-helix transcriptional regulator [Anaerocolumna jejuensis]SHJ65482.1 DNA-binding transcriptional regulator, XRE-family HTH domain [Anaerocolumna jejuensis DSM 15929]
MNIGRKIKSLRLQKSVTQEELAGHLSISAQAVSKWENEITTPDIQLLPELSAFFGVTIDELFDVEDQTHLERIENMLHIKRILSKVDYDYAEHFLKEKMEDNAHRGKALSLLADLHNHEAAMHNEQAEYYAKEALKENPTWKCNHVALLWAQHGTMPDWNYSNHHKRIAYYQQFVKENPDYARGYLYLLDELIADGRLEEAEGVLAQMKEVEDDCRVKMYAGEIAWAAGKHNEAYSIWADMVKQEPDNWLVYAYTADRYAAGCRYKEAIEFNKMAFKLQPSPKYMDAAECIAHIHEITGEYERAVEAWEELIRELETEWNITEGEAIDRPLREIAQLKEFVKE